MDNLIACKLCGSLNTIKYGIQNGTQYYFCKDCQHKFKADTALYGGRVPAEYISSALSGYYRGLSVDDICKSLDEEHQYHPSKSVVFKWINKFSDKAVKYYAQNKPEVGDQWVADETVIHLDNRDIWLWDIIDTRTKFLLASKLSYSRNTSDAETLFELAKRKAGKSPKEILTDKLPAYPDAIYKVFEGKTFHLQSRPTAGGNESTNPIERWHNTLKERTKVMRALRDPETALSFTDGFITYYNFIRPHEGLGGKTPAEAAGIKCDTKSWAGVTHIAEVPKEEPMPVIVTTGLDYRRRIITGKPYKPGRKRKPTVSKPAVIHPAVMAVSPIRRKRKNA